MLWWNSKPSVKKLFKHLKRKYQNVAKFSYLFCCFKVSKEYDFTKIFDYLEFLKSEKKFRFHYGYSDRTFLLYNS